MRKLHRPDTSVREDITLQGQLDPTSARAVGASLDALCLEARPKLGGLARRITIGRSPEADVVLIDETISRIHAEVLWDAEKTKGVLRDLVAEMSCLYGFRGCSGCRGFDGESERTTRKKGSSLRRALS
jgi:hypothetical protein